MKKDRVTTDDLAIMVKKGFDSVDKKIVKIEAKMVTKDYLDRKLAELKGDLVVILRREDSKVNELIDTLHRKDVLTGEDIRPLREIHVFPELPET